MTFYDSPSGKIFLNIQIPTIAAPTGKTAFVDDNSDGIHFPVAARAK